jgi:hypothetical protein
MYFVKQLNIRLKLYDWEEASASSFYFANTYFTLCAVFGLQTQDHTVLLRRWDVDNKDMVLATALKELLQAWELYDKAV